MPILLTILATLFWGFGFIASVWGLVDFDAMALTFFRLAIAAVIMLPLARRSFNWREIRTAIPAGLFLGLGLILQTEGLKTTSASKSGFLTTLYVLIVPLIEWQLLHKPIRRTVIVGAMLAFVGTAMLASPGLGEGLQSISRGDWLTIGCAVVFAGQIAAVSHAQPRITSAWSFSFWQTTIGALATLPFVHTWPTHVSPKAAWGLGWLGVFSSVLAFSFQIKAQRHLSASLSATLYLLEGPFAALFGWWLLGDSLNALQWTGAGIVIAAAVLATR